MNKTVENILACRKVVEREISRPLTTEEENIVRVSFLFGQNKVYDDMLAEEAMLQAAKKLWEELGDVPVDEDDDLEEDWKHFPAGTNKFEVWQWFEDKFNVSVAKDLMYKNDKVEALKKYVENRPKLTIEHDEDEVTILMEDGTEVVHWVRDEWEEDPTLINVICNAIIMAQVHPEKLIKINQHHIDCQRAMQ